MKRLIASLPLILCFNSFANFTVPHDREMNDLLWDKTNVQVEREDILVSGQPIGFYNLSKTSENFRCVMQKVDLSPRDERTPEMPNCSFTGRATLGANLQKISLNIDLADYNIINATESVTTDGDGEYTFITKTKNISSRLSFSCNTIS